MPAKRPPIPGWQNPVPWRKTQPGDKSVHTDQTPLMMAACAPVPFIPRRGARESNGRLRRELASPTSPLGQGWEVQAHLRHRQGDSVDINWAGTGVNHPSRQQLTPTRACQFAGRQQCYTQRAPLLWQRLGAQGAGLGR